MAVYKDKWNGYKGTTWRVACYYKDWKGVRRKHEKRGFSTKKEALKYEREFLAKILIWDLVLLLISIWEIYDHS